MTIDRYAFAPPATNLRHALPLPHRPRHRLEVYTRQGMRLACLYGEDRQALEERAARWRKYVAGSLEVRCPDE